MKNLLQRHLTSAPGARCGDRGFSTGGLLKPVAVIAGGFAGTGTGSVNSAADYGNPSAVAANIKPDYSNGIRTIFDGEVAGG